MQKQNLKKINWLLLLMLTLIVIGNLYLSFTYKEPKKEILTINERQGWFLDQKTVVKPKNFPLVQPKINAKAFLVMEAETKNILAQENAFLPLYPASAVKMMTALVAREAYQQQTPFIINEQDLTGGNSLRLTVGERVNFDLLIKAMLINSNNQASEILANHLSGGKEAFIKKMNEKAQLLGLKNSYFANPQGFDQREQQTTAFDLAILALELERDPYLAEIVSQIQTTVKNDSGRSWQISNTNQLLQRKDLVYNVFGVKTGTTPLAGEVLISLIQKDKQKIIVVVLSARNRYNETIKLANFVWDNYQWQTVTE